MKKKENLQLRLLKLFKENKCLTINELSNSLHYAVISVRLILKDHGYYSSFTHNSKWYTLRTIPVFEKNGLWFHDNIGFSRHGNLSQTIYYFVNQSRQGLTAKEISEIILMPCHPVLNMMYKKGQIDRVNTRNGFVYISKEKHKSERQTYLISQSEKFPLPSDADAVKILVEMIKNPTYTADELSSSLGDKITCKPESITHLLQYHELEKKTRKRREKSF